MLTEDDIRALTDEAIGDLYSMVVREMDARQVRSQARATIEQTAAAYAQAVATQPPKRAEDMDATAMVGPGEHVIIDGTEWVNNTAAWLSPHTAGPADYPMGWRTAKEEDLPAADQWTIGRHYKPGDTVTFAGGAWRCLQEHDAQAGWDPLAVQALWAPA